MSRRLQFTGRRRIALTYAALALTDSVLAGSSSHRAKLARRITKPLLMPALAATLPADRSDALAERTRLAHAFSWGGDVALLSKSEPAFLAGVASFFAAHVSYIAAFGSIRDRAARPTDRGPKAAGAIWVGLAPVLAAAAAKKDPKLRLPVAAYGGILATMFATSTMLDRDLPQSARRKVMAGTSLFLLSDSLLGIQEFLLEQRDPRLEASVMVTYTAGQWLIADGVAEAGRSQQGRGHA